MERLLNELRKRRGNQKGFTLIEMLVVISILGILAAVVTISMVGITGIAQRNADNAEKKTVQVALDAMAAQQQVPVNALCTNAPDTDDMATFPVTGSTAANGLPVALFPTYIHQQKTSHKYTCSAQGVVDFG
jgi:prepilin-type N-terminal cleavage/methylation domain-containing protein